MENHDVPASVYHSGSCGAAETPLFFHFSKGKEPQICGSMSLVRVLRAFFTVPTFMLISKITL